MARGGKQPGAGRPAGTPNKATLEFKGAVNNLINHATPNMVEWLDKIAGTSPEKAFDIISKLAEYAHPKLARTEIRNPDGETFKTETLNEGDKAILERFKSELLKGAKK